MPDNLVVYLMQKSEIKPVARSLAFTFTAKDFHSKGDNF